MTAPSDRNPAEFKAGEKIVCVDNSNVEGQLRMGETYGAAGDAENRSNDGKWRVRVVADDGRVHDYFCSRFRAAKPESGEQPRSFDQMVCDSIAESPEQKRTNYLVKLAAEFTELEAANAALTKRVEELKGLLALPQEHRTKMVSEHEKQRDDEPWRTPPEVAKLLRIDPCKVTGWCSSGVLKASNLAANLEGRPRWRISDSALREFLESRQSCPPTVRPSRRRRQATGAKEYF